MADIDIAELRRKLNAGESDDYPGICSELLDRIKHLTEALQGAAITMKRHKEEIERLRAENEEALRSNKVISDEIQKAWAEVQRLRAEVKENETAFGKADALLTYQKARIEKLEKALWKGIRWTRKALEYEPDWLGEAREALERK